MAHMNTLRGIYSENLRGLICHITSHDADSPEVKRFEDTVISNVAYRSYPTVSKRSVLATIDGFVDKFRTHGFPGKASNLRKLADRYVQCDYFRKPIKNELSQWSLLSLLIQLSYKPTDALCDDEPIVLPPRPSEQVLTSSETEFDWPAYLRQGSEKFRLPSSSSDDDSVWELTDDDEAVVSEGVIPPAPPLPQVASVRRDSSPSSVVQRREVTTQRNLVDELKDLSRAEDWLRNNVQLGWWNDTGLRETPPSRHPTANFFFIWEEAMCGDDARRVDRGDTRILSEYKVTREIVWLLSRPENCSIVHRAGAHFRAREDVSISSLSPPVFRQFLDTEVCPYLPMIESLVRFQSEMLNSDKSSRVVPNTYISYSTALGDILFEYTEKLAEIESAISKQDGVATMMYVVNEIRPWLRNIEFVYQMHKEAVFTDWLAQENWLCADIQSQKDGKLHYNYPQSFKLKMASKRQNMFSENKKQETTEIGTLLTVVYNRLAVTISDWEKKGSLALFLGAFRPYSHILGTWLGETRLVDRKNEYFITRPLDAMREGNLAVRDYKRRLNELGIDDTTFLDSVVDVAFRAVSSVDFLVLFQKDGGVRQECLPSDAMFTDLVSSLQGHLLSSCTPIGALPGGKRRRRVVSSLYHTDSDIAIDRLDLNSRRGLLHSEDFFKCDAGGLAERAFQLYSTAGAHVEYEPDPVEILLERLEGCDISGVPVNVFLLREVYDSTVRYMRPRGFAGDILLTEYGLGSHLEALRGVYLLQSGRAMHAFATQLFKEMLHENLCSVGWTEKLTSLLEEDMPRHSGRFTVSVVPTPSSTHVSELVSIGYIDLHYQPGSPLCLIITEPIIKDYNTFFKFFLQLKWSLYTLQKLMFKDFLYQETLLTRRLYSMRTWLLHTVSVIHRYLMCVPASSFEEQITRICCTARDLQTIITAYKKAIESWKAHCFLTEGHPCRSIVQTVFEMCERLRLLWCLGRRRLLCSYQLDAVESNYQLTVGNLANAVQDLAADDGSGVFGILHDELVNNIPLSLNED